MSASGPTLGYSLAPEISYYCLKILFQEIIKKELSKVLNKVGNNGKMMVTTSSMLVTEMEGMVAWLTDLQMLVVMTGQGWRQVVVSIR